MASEFLFPDDLVPLVPEHLHDRAVFAAALLYGAYQSLAFESREEALLQGSILNAVREYIPDIEENLDKLLDAIEADQREPSDGD